VPAEDYDPDVCGVPRCHYPAVLTHLGKPLCGKHWEALCKRQDDDEQREAAERRTRVQRINAARAKCRAV